ncbi:hypothetical protein SMA90_34240, partial [Escherichia coli]
MEDKAFHNSVRFVVMLLIWTLTYVVLVSFLFGFAVWEQALAASVLLLPAPLFFYQYHKWFRIAR